VRGGRPLAARSRRPHGCDADGHEEPDLARSSRAERSRPGGRHPGALPGRGGELNMDRRALKPAIEPLSQRTWQTIETRVFAQLEQPTRPPAPSVGRPTLALGVAGLALAASLLALLQNVVWRPHQQQTAPAKPAAALVAPAAPLQAPHFVTTSGPVEVRLGDSRVRIAEHSDVRVEGSDDEGWRVLLEQGEV